MIKSIARWLRLFFYGCWISSKEFFNYLNNVRCFYKHRGFARTDLHLHTYYFFNNPYRLCQQARAHLPASLTQPYGETPLLAFSKLINSLNLTEKDYFIELGCGRGQLAFWLAHFTSCSILAVDIVPEFIRYGNYLAQQHQLSQLHFEYNNMLEVDFSSAHYVYLYGTSLEDEYITQLIEKLNQLPNNACVISVSYSLAEYGATNFILEKQNAVRFIWGDSYFYVQRKVDTLN